MTLVDWSYAIMESGHQCRIAVCRCLATKRRLLPADSLASLNILVSEILVSQYKWLH